MLIILGVAIGVVVGLSIDRLIIKPLTERWYRKMCVKAGLIPIQWFYRRR